MRFSPCRPGGSSRGIWNATHGACWTWAVAAAGPSSSSARSGGYYRADIFRPYLLQCRTTGLHEDVVCCDVGHLPFPPESFDVVLCGEVVEHLERLDALALVKSMAIARRQVVISTPVGRCPQQAYDGNPHQAHRSTWLPQDFRRLGYAVRGSGLRGMGGLVALAQETSPLPEWLRLVANAVWMLASPFSYYFPRIGGAMVCVKNIRSHGLKAVRETTLSLSGGSSPGGDGRERTRGM